MLTCFKDHKIYIHILNHILDLAWLKSMKLTLEQQYMLSVLHDQYHACWSSGDFRSQGISRHGIDLKSQNISSAASEELISLKQDECNGQYIYWLLNMIKLSSYYFKLGTIFFF